MRNVLAVILAFVMVSFIFTGCGSKHIPCEQQYARCPACPDCNRGVLTAQMEPTEKPEAVRPTNRSPVVTKEEDIAVISSHSFTVKEIRLQFAFDKALLTDKSRQTLVEIADWMKSNPKESIQIQGHTCNVGTAEYNLALGDRRANSAKNYLVGLGINANRITTISYGLEKPRFPNTDELNRSLNRRDEFNVVK